MVVGPGGACDLEGSCSDTELQVDPHRIPDKAGSIREVKVNCQGSERSLKDHMQQVNGGGSIERHLS